MPAVSTNNTQGKVHPMRNFVITQLQGGADRDMLVAELGKSGVEESMARQLVESAYRETQNGPVNLPSSSSSSSIQPAILAGLAASLVAGAIWGGVALLTGWEIGFMALFVGGAVGYAILLFSNGETSSTHQIVAIAYAIFGILIGRYVTFYVILKDIVAQELGPETAAGMSIFSFELFGTFLTGMGEFLGVWDLLWMVLACITAWRLTDPSRA